MMNNIIHGDTEAASTSSSSSSSQQQQQNGGAASSLFSRNDFYNTSNLNDLSSSVAFTNHSIDQITTNVAAAAAAANSLNIGHHESTRAPYSTSSSTSSSSSSSSTSADTSLPSHRNNNNSNLKLHNSNSNSNSNNIQVSSKISNGFRQNMMKSAVNNDAHSPTHHPTSSSTSNSNNTNNTNSNSNINNNNNNSNELNSNSNGSNQSNGLNDKTTNNGNSSNTNNNLDGQLPNGNGSSSKLAYNRVQSFSSGQKDVLRIIGQYLRYLGLNKTTETLIDESMCMLEHPTATNFCQLIMSGSWDEAEKALNSLKPLMEESNTDITNMKFLILEQKYLECLEDGKIFEALKCLRDEMAPLKHNIERLHELSSFLMCSDQCNLKVLSKWSGKNTVSRQNLMDKLQTYLPPNVMLPPHRLEVLLQQSIELQCDRCPFHNIDKNTVTIDNWQFLRDHICTKDDFPSTCLQVINDHCDEVWFCKFSNNGKFLATGSKDGCLIIWDIDPVTYKISLNKSYEEHSSGVGYIAWSPDDHYVIVCGTEESTELWIWDVQNKTLKKRVNNNHDDSLTCAAWLPDGQNFVAGGLKGQFYYCDLDGNVRDTWEGIRVRCLQALPDGLVLAADSLKRIRSYNFKEISDSNVIQEDFQVMSFTLNKSGTMALINVSTQGIHLWDLKDKILVRRFQGALQTNFMNNSSFGGVDEQYIVSGSEDNKIYIWNSKKENPICVLEGHTRNVNSVTWNPVLNGMVASASDDGTVRIWGPSKAASATTTTSTS